jgi:hypothetical protein
MEDAMQYLAALLGGVAASALFWVVDKYLLALPQTYQILGAVAAFSLFGLAGYLLASRKAGSTECRLDRVPIRHGSRVGFARQ